MSVSERRWPRDLKTARAYHGLTQREAAEKLNALYPDLAASTWLVILAHIEAGWVEPRRIAWVLEDFIAESTKGEQS